MGGEDKGLLLWQGKRLIDHVIDRIAPQVCDLMISCNRNRQIYRALAPLTPADLRPGFQGPLAGLEAARTVLSGEYVLLVPCDTPQLPTDLAVRLHSILHTKPHAQVSYAHTGNAGQYLCALLRVSALHSLSPFLDSGERAVRKWYGQIGAIEVDFAADQAAFLNLNEISALTT